MSKVKEWAYEEAVKAVDKISNIVKTAPIFEPISINRYISCM